jgi:TIR domain
MRVWGPPGQVDYFISYAAADRAWAEWIAWQLEPAGCRGTGTADAAGRVPPW